MATLTPDVWEPYYGKVSAACLAEFEGAESCEPFALLKQLLHLEGLPMHCPVHHHILPAVLLTVVRKAQAHPVEVLERDLAEAEKRARNILPGFCGFYGACGAAVGLGVFFSVITDATPYSAGKPWAWANQATGKTLLDISEMGGPRCCKRTSYTALQSVLPLIAETINIQFTIPDEIVCDQDGDNHECLRKACPYYKDSLRVETGQ